MADIVVYTVILSDGYERLKDQPAIPGVDYVALTDDLSLRSATWHLAPVRHQESVPWLTSRYHKYMPHRLAALQSYRWSIWIDGNVRILDSDFATAAVDLARESGLALFPHPDRDCIIEEAELCFDWPKYKGHRVLEHAAWCRARGYPEHGGLFASGILAREHGRRQMKRLGGAWMRQVRRWGRQDQIGLPYLLRRMGIEPGLFPFDLWSNPWLVVDPHAADAPEPAS